MPKQNKFFYYDLRNLIGGDKIYVRDKNDVARVITDSEKLDKIKNLFHTHQELEYLYEDNDELYHLINSNGPNSDIEHIEMIHNNLCVVNWKKLNKLRELLDL